MEKVIQNIPLTNGVKSQAGHPSVWWIQPKAAEGCEILLSDSDSREKLKLPPFCTGILVSCGKQVSVQTGEANVVNADLVALAKLQAFIDNANPAQKFEKFASWHTFYPVRNSRKDNDKTFETWLINLNLKPSENARRFIAALRETEWYWVVSYLLESRNQDVSLKTLGDKYGLSASHFRRVSKAALGNTTKEELCHWRLAKALLDLMENEISITEVALKHGYASLSHFSNDVKCMLGVSPKQLKKILGSNENEI